MKLYDYDKNINIIKTVGGEWVITLTDEIATEILNYIFDASELAENEGRGATAESITALWKALRDKAEEAKGGEND